MRGLWKPWRGERRGERMESSPVAAIVVGRGERALGLPYRGLCMAGGIS